MLSKIDNQIKESLKNRDELRLGVLRQLKTALNNEAIASKKKDKGLDEAEALKVAKREANKRKDAIAAFTAGNRAELAEVEKKELVIIEEFLPEQMSEEAIAKIVNEVISRVNPAGPQDFGKVMGPVMGKLGVQADGNVVKKIIQEKIKK